MKHTAFSDLLKVTESSQELGFKLKLTDNRVPDLLLRTCLKFLSKY